MATVLFDAVAPGRGATRPAFVGGARALKILTGRFTFDSSYATGGEDISEIFNLFAGAAPLVIEFTLEAAPGTFNAKVVNSFPVDYAAKKVLAFGDDTTTGVPAEVAAATNLAALTVRWTARGYR